MASWRTGYLPKLVRLLAEILPANADPGDVDGLHFIPALSHVVLSPSISILYLLDDF